MMRTIRKVGGGILVELKQMELNKLETNVVAGSETETPEFLQDLVFQYQQVFEVPKGLPRKRNHEHAIVLKKGSNPVSVRPYRYPQF